MAQYNDQEVLSDPSEQHAVSRQDSDMDQDMADYGKQRQSSDLSRTKSNVSIAEQMSPIK